MVSFSRVFRPAPPPPKTVVDKIAGLTTQSAEFIAGTALGNDDEALRIAAIDKLDAGDALNKLAGLDESMPASVAIQRAAQQRIAQLIDAGTIDFVAFCNQTTNKPALLSVATLCSDATRAQQAIGFIGDPALLMKLAIDAPSTKVRQLAAETIQDPVQLKHLLRDARGKDKNVYKIVKQKCDALHAQEKIAAETQATIVTICAALERQVHQPFDNLFAPTLEHLYAQWNTVVTHASDDIKARVEQANDRCCEIITKHVQLVASQAARAAAITHADEDRQSVLGELRNILVSISVSESPVRFDTEIGRCRERWAHIARYKPADTVDSAQFDRLGKAITELTELIAKQGTLHQQAAHFRDVNSDANLTEQSQVLRKMLASTALLNDAVPAIATEAATLLHAWEQSRADKHAAEAQALRQVSGLIRKATGALGDGKTGQTAGMRRAIEGKLHTLPSVPVHLANQLQQLDEKLSELQDWKSYAVAPKRVQLIEKMEALIGFTDDPNVLAEHIKRLQDEWKSISKGSVENTDAEWQRFHQAAQTAYQPCREYFAAQAKQRDENLDKRKALLSRLDDFITAQNWEQTDWREVARAIRESNQQWRSHQPVERAANKPLQVRFDAITSELQSRLETEYAKNIEEKKSLITRVQRAVENDDSRQAIDEVKRLQMAWKDVGIVARDDDQKLWQEFRQHCDAVFAKRQQQHGEYVAELEANKTKAMALCDEAEQLLGLSGPELLNGAKKLSALREIFDAIGELPKASARELQTRFERALEKCERNVTQQHARDKSLAWHNLLEAGGKIREYRFALLTEMHEDECSAFKQAAQTFIDGVPHWPKGGAQAVKNELARQGATDIAANEVALRTLCIRAEILTDISTPQADQSFRRNYQLQRLKQGMGQARSSTKDELEAMMFEWISVGATNAAVYAELLARFNRCRDQHQKHQ